MVTTYEILLISLYIGHSGGFGSQIISHILKMLWFWVWHIILTACQPCIHTPCSVHPSVLFLFTALDWKKFLDSCSENTICKIFDEFGTNWHMLEPVKGYKAHKFRDSWCVYATDCAFA